MSFCKENEDCNPIKCHVFCDRGNELRELFENSKCGEKCVWTKQEINGINACKDAQCPIVITIADFRKK